MALEFNWYQGEVRETIWKGDKALGPIPKDVLESWEKDPDASKLLPFAKPGEQPTVFTYRSLEQKERSYCESQYESGRLVAVGEAFKISVKFPMSGDPIKMEDGTTRERYVKVGVIRLMADQLALGIERANPGIIYFYGMRILGGAFMSEEEKKALSPPPTEKPSSEEGSTLGDTAGTDKPAPDKSAAA